MVMNEESPPHPPQHTDTPLALLPMNPLSSKAPTQDLGNFFKNLVGANGKVFGLESFGFSAPYKVLDEKLGFTAQNVYNQVKEMFN